PQRHWDTKTPTSLLAHGDRYRWHWRDHYEPPRTTGVEDFAVQHPRAIFLVGCGGVFRPPGFFPSVCGGLRFVLGGGDFFFGHSNPFFPLSYPLFSFFGRGPAVSVLPI